MAYQQLGLAKFGFKNSINTDENNNSVCKTEKRKASKLNYEENKRIQMENSNCGQIYSICHVGETQTSFSDGCNSYKIDTI